MPTPESSPRPTVLRVGDLSSLVVAVEHMVGFRPSESLVAVALCGPRERLTFTLRLDLPDEHDGDQAVAAIATEVARRMACAEADAVILFVHTDEPPVAGRLPRRELVEAVEAALGAPLREAALVSSERLWSYICTDPRCCPPEGRQFDRESSGALALAAAHAMLGNAVLSSRDELVESVRPVGGIAAFSMQQALDRATHDMLEVGPAAFADEVGAEIDCLRERFADPRASLSDDEAARVAVALGDRLLRDRMLVDLSDPDDEALRRLLSVVARRAQTPDDAAVCTCVGYAAYVDGSGVVASAALERALRSDPDYSLAQMLLTMLEHQVSPKQVRECAAGIGDEVDRLISRRRRR